MDHPEQQIYGNPLMLDSVKIFKKLVADQHIEWLENDENLDFWLDNVQGSSLTAKKYLF